MIITNIDWVYGKKIIEHYGLVSGSTVRTKHIGKDIWSDIKNIFGGELKAYTRLLNESRDQATQRMIQQAESVGANAIINVRLATSVIVSRAAEIYVYGTAVKVE